MRDVAEAVVKQVVKSEDLRLQKIVAAGLLK